MKAKEFIKSEMYKDSHLKGHIEQMDAIKQMLVIELLEKYAEYKAKKSYNPYCAVGLKLLRVN